MSTTRDAALKAFQGASLTRHVGRPTLKGVSQTRNEISAAYAKAKTQHDSFPMGERFGFAAAIMRPKKYIRLHNDVCPARDELNDAWTFTHPDRPSAYDAGIAGQVGDVTRRRKEAAHNDKIVQWDRFDALETTYKDAIEEAYDAAYLAEMKDDVLGFSHLTVADLLTHLEDKCLALTTLQKNKKLADINCVWDKNDDIGTYFAQVERLEEELLDHYGITWPEEMQLLQVVAQMYECGIFTRKEIMAWESKPNADKNMANAETYFTEIWEECQRYGGTVASAAGFGESANAATEKPTQAPDELIAAIKEVAIAATADKEHIQQMTSTNDDLLAVVKRQQEQIDSLIAQNGQLASALAKLKPSGRNNTNPGGRNNSNRRGNKKRERENTDKDDDDGPPAKKATPFPKCPICGMSSHAMEDCWELETNKENRPDGWVSARKENRAANNK